MRAARPGAGAVFGARTPGPGSLGPDAGARGLDGGPLGLGPRGADRIPPRAPWAQGAP